MSNNNKDTAGLTLAEKTEASLNRFLGGNKKLLLIIVGLIIVALIVVGIVVSVNHKSLQNDFNQISLLEKSYTDVKAMDTEDASYQSTYDTLVSDLNALADGGKKYPNLRAEYLLGIVAFDAKEYQNAMDDFMKVYSEANGSYLGSLSLTNAAVAAEELGNDSLALEYYTKVIDEFGFAAAESPKALFGQARLEEKQGNTDLAKATFQQLADQFPNSEYASLATNRLALL